MKIRFLNSWAWNDTWVGLTILNFYYMSKYKLGGFVILNLGLEFDFDPKRKL